jgi:methylmalonyl-CoA mutase
MPVFGTSAATFDDDGVTALYHHLRDLLAADGLPVSEGRLARPPGRPPPPGRGAARRTACATSRRSPRPCGLPDETQAWAELARRRQHLQTAREVVGEAVAPALDEAERALPAAAAALLEEWPRTVEEYSGDELVVTVRDRELRTSADPGDALGQPGPPGRPAALADHGDLLRFLRSENLPGRFPFTAGVFPFKRDGEDPARMFAGEGDAFRTNRRFHLLSEHAPAKRLSTAFDSVTLYGRDPDTRPDVYGKVGTSGVSIATLEDMRRSTQGSTSARPRRRCR